MNLSIAVPLLLSMSSAYLLLQDEDINRSTRFVSKRKERQQRYFQKCATMNLYNIDF